MSEMKEVKGMEVNGKLIKSCILVALVLSNLSGCALLQPSQPEYLPNDRSMISLNHIAEKAEKSNAALAAVQSHQYKSLHTVYRNTSVKKQSVTTQEISFNFKGNLDTALRQLSQQVNYSYLTEGTPPQLIPSISVDKKNMTLPSIIENINAQLPSTAKVVLYQKTHTLLAVYH